MRSNLFFSLHLGQGARTYLHRHHSPFWPISLVPSEAPRRPFILNHMHGRASSDLVPLVSYEGRALEGLESGGTPLVERWVADVALE